MENPYLVAGAVVAILVLVIYVNQRLAQRARAAAANADEGPSAGDLLCKFVHHEGNVVGETVAIEGDMLVLKQEGVFKSVPRSQVKVDGDDLVLSGFVDWEAAKERGGGWLERSTPGAHPEVSAHLTRSEDVRAPAREAFLKREADLAPAKAESSSEEE